MAQTGSATPETRRGQRRQATLREITSTARQLLLRDGIVGVTVRAIAREMGMTPPALYRYFDSHEDVVSALTADLYDELVAVMEQARDAQPADDVAARLFAVTLAFRQWALDHRPEFGLVFANPITSMTAQLPDACELAGQRFGLVFGALFNELWQSRPFDVPDLADLDPHLVEQIEAFDDEVRGGLPVGATYLFLRCWVSLYGTVTMEVFNHLHWALEDSEPMFETVMADNARILGLADDHRRLYG